MAEISDICYWIKGEFKKHFSEDSIEIWAFGSAISQNNSPNDFDLLLVFDDSLIKEVSNFSQVLIKHFGEKFCMQLHMLRLTHKEAKETEDFICHVLNNYHIKIFP